MTAIEIAEGNLERGFAVSRDYVQTNSFTFCTGSRIGNHGFGGGLLACNRGQLKAVTTPVPINLEEEQLKLVSMQRRLAAARELRDQRIGACYQSVGG